MFATWLTGETIRTAAATPQFLAGVLGFVVSDASRLERIMSWKPISTDAFSGRAVRDPLASALVPGSG